MHPRPTSACLTRVLLNALLALVLSVALFSSSRGQEKVILRLTDWADLDEMPLDQQAVAEFMKLHPVIDVLYEPNPGRQYEEKILTAIVLMNSTVHPFRTTTTSGSPGCGMLEAMSWVLFLIIMAVTYIQLKLISREIEYG